MCDRVLFLIGNAFLDQSNVSPGNQNDFLLDYVMNDIATIAVAEEGIYHRRLRCMWVNSCGDAIIMPTKIIVSCNQILCI